MKPHERTKFILDLCVIALAALALCLFLLWSAGAASSAVASLWASTPNWQIPDAPYSVPIVERQIGTNVAATEDDTAEIRMITLQGSRVLTHSSPWQQVDVTQYGVPADASAVRLGVKAAITSIATPAVYAFVRKTGSELCPGPPGFENYPVDFAWYGDQNQGWQKCWAIHAAIMGRNGVREFNTVEVPLVNGTFEWAWGYRRKAGIWPNGDAVSIGFWINGWSQ